MVKKTVWELKDLTEDGQILFWRLAKDIKGTGIQFVDRFLC
jgi:hypothetical protein